MRRFVRRAAFAASAAATAAVAVLLVDMLRFDRQRAEPPIPIAVDVDATAVAARLAASLRFVTISNADPVRTDRTSFRQLHRFLEETFPLVYRNLAHEQLDESLIFTWPGTQPDAAPIVLLAHQDVVPVEPGTDGRWRQPPWAGRIADGFVWGRGALDDKLNLIAQLQAVELLLARGWQPRRTVYLCHGADEEVGGQTGAAQLAERLRARGVAPLLVLDEGMVVAEGMLPAPAPVALIGVAEKGYVSIELRAVGESGHSSMPPAHTAVGRIAAAVARLEAEPLPVRLHPVTRQLLEAIGPSMSFPKRLVMANLWLFGPLVARNLSRQPVTNAIVRTTVAATVIEGGSIENVLPSSARAVVNVRTLPGDTVDGVTEAVRRRIGDGGVVVTPLASKRVDPSPIAPDDEVFALVGGAARQTFPDALVAPALLLGGTDARYYTSLTPHVYRFSPVRLGPGDGARLHGTDERVAVDDVGKAVEFYVRLLLLSAR